MDGEASVELIARAGHEADAFGDIYRMYVRRVFAFCLAHSGSRELAEDVTSQTFERALRNIGQYQDRGVPLSHWLLRIAANGIAEQLRRPRSVTLSGDVASSVSRPLDDLDPGELVDLWEWSELLQAHIGTLTVNQQRVLRLRFWDDRPLQQIAVELGCRPDAARQLLHRAIDALRKRVLQSKDGGDYGRQTQILNEWRRRRSRAVTEGEGSVPSEQRMG